MRLAGSSPILRIRTAIAKELFLDEPDKVCLSKGQWAWENKESKKKGAILRSSVNRNIFCCALYWTIPSPASSYIEIRLPDEMDQLEEFLGTLAMHLMTPL